MLEHLPHQLYGDKQADKGLTVMENQEMQAGDFQRVTVVGNGGSACSAGCSFVREIQGFVGRIAEHLFTLTELLEKYTFDMYTLESKL